MKKMRLPETILSLIIFICSFECCFAQAIPNGGFEQWTYYPGTVIELPKHWMTNDILYKHYDEGYKGETVKKTEHSHSGRYALQMEVNINHGDTVNGGIYSTGRLDSLLMLLYKTRIAGFACNIKYESFTGYYIFTGKQNDSAIFGVNLTCWNEKKHRRDTLVNTTLKVGENTPDYIPFVMPLKYRIKDEIPDTAFIAIGIQGANNMPAHVGSMLIIDDLNFSGEVKNTQY